MSRGPGRIQRFIIDTLERTAVESEFGDPLRLWPVPALAEIYGWQHMDAYIATNSAASSPSIRYALNRAATKLFASGAVTTWDVVMNTQLGADGPEDVRARRRVLCAALPDTENLTRADVRVAELLMAHSKWPDFAARIAEIRERTRGLYS